jgi:hypothetical protein
MRRIPFALCIVLAAVLLTVSTATFAGPVTSVSSLATPRVQEDFPAMCLDATGTPWVAYVEWNGKADTLKIARRAGAKLTATATLAGPGIIHRPAIACDGSGAIWVVWSQVSDKDVMDLHAQCVVDGKVRGKPVTLATSPAGDVFADAGTDAAGRVWVAWQSFRNGQSDIFARCYDPSAVKWGEEIQVTSNQAGDWEPRLAFAGKTAAIAFDSSRNGNFDVYLAQIAGGKVTLKQITKTPFYEGRASIAAAPDGGSYWIAWERGKQLWAKNTRGVSGSTGLNARKAVDVVRFDVASGTITPLADPSAALKAAALKTAAAPARKGKKAQPAAPKKAKKAPKAAGGVLNLPEVATDGAGNVWIAARRSRGKLWTISLVRYDAKQKAWSAPAVLPDSSFSQDRRCQTARDANGALWLAWPSDKRTSNKARTSGVYLAKVDSSLALAVPPTSSPAATATAAAPATPIARWGDDTPERTRADRHVWKVDGKTYYLYWGDFHRHTDISNCRVVEDGCIVDQFRYAYDIGLMDFLGTSDHTDAGKPYDPYEWWCNQKLADVFYAPSFFNSFYVYEREQKWPWGHRNVIFPERGGPVIYIKRALYKSMPWSKTLPAGAGGADITPMELWKLLRTNGMDVTIISHTGATGMGTDWDKYGKIDHAVENLVEIYQGARVSYEGTNTPQPTVGFPKGKKLQADAHGSVKTGKGFGKYNKGVYQNALRNGYNLGVFANSDHISTHTSFGGVYTESFTRKGILDALNARRTIAGTDKIFIEFTCNGHLLGRIFETADKPKLTVRVRGTAPLRAVTIVRNEMNIRRTVPKTKTTDLDVTFTDEEPIKGVNRYYVRVEQVDGNMGWASPVWVTYTK